MISGLVGASVTNSRSARKDVRAKSRIETTVPVVTAITNRPAITHQARIRALMLSTVARADALETRRSRIHPAIDENEQRQDAAMTFSAPVLNQGHAQTSS